MKIEKLFMYILYYMIQKFLYDILLPDVDCCFVYVNLKILKRGTFIHVINSQARFDDKYAAVILVFFYYILLFHVENLCLVITNELVNVFWNISWLCSAWYSIGRIGRFYFSAILFLGLFLLHFLKSNLSQFQRILKELPPCLSVKLLKQYISICSRFQIKTGKNKYWSKKIIYVYFREWKEYC